MTTCLGTDIFILAGNISGWGQGKVWRGKMQDPVGGEKGGGRGAGSNDGNRKGATGDGNTREGQLSETVTEKIVKTGRN